MSLSGKRAGLEVDEEARRRQSIRDEVRSRFARYGDRPCACVLESALHPQGMQRLMEDLGLPFTASFDRQLELVARFMMDHGSSVVVNRHQRHRGQFQNITKVSDRHEGGDATPAGRTPIPQADQPAQPESSPGLTPGRWFDAEGNYIGPERRNSGERRQPGDRRDKIDAINKNKRYGGDRRKQRGRRKTDR